MKQIKLGKSVLNYLTKNVCYDDFITTGKGKNKKTVRNFRCSNHHLIGNQAVFTNGHILVFVPMELVTGKVEYCHGPGCNFRDTIKRVAASHKYHSTYTVEVKDLKKVHKVTRAFETEHATFSLNGNVQVSFKNEVGETGKMNLEHTVTGWDEEQTAKFDMSYIYSLLGKSRRAQISISSCGLTMRLRTDCLDAMIMRINPPLKEKK